MTASRQKLDTFSIDDRHDLSMDELLARARHVAGEDALVYGWVSIAVEFSAARPSRNGDFLRHSFDVFGVSAEGAEALPERNSDPGSSPVRGTAASSADESF